VEDYLINVPSIDWEHSTDLQAVFLINTAKSLPCQHRANKEEGATSAALMPFAFSHLELPLNIALFEINKIEPPEFSHEMNDKTRFLHGFEFLMQCVYPLFRMAKGIHRTR